MSYIATPAGIRKTRVFLHPVLAAPMTSFPFNSGGIALSSFVYLAVNQALLLNVNESSLGVQRKKKSYALLSALLF